MFQERETRSHISFISNFSEQEQGIMSVSPPGFGEKSEDRVV